MKRSDTFKNIKFPLKNNLGICPLDEATEGGYDYSPENKNYIDMTDKSSTLPSLKWPKYVFDKRKEVKP